MFAVIEYGSVVRGSNDLHSDKDLLIVCDPNKRELMREYYEEAGYSVSIFTFSQLQFMQKKGSLFIQHLKSEGRVLVDDQNVLQNWLKTCYLMPPSHDEILRCVQAVQFISTWPEDFRISGWKADFLYCVSRDLLVKSLAAHGILAFGISDIEREFNALYSAVNFNFKSLESLRRIKSAYRGGEFQALDVEPVTRTWLTEVANLLSFCVSGPFSVSAERFVAELKNRKFTSQYELLRTVEAAYAILRHYGFEHSRHKNLMECIIRPNMYGSSQVRKQRNLYSYFEDLIEIMTNKVLQTDQIKLS